ncbi:hypothetical protein BGW80DRAFT_1449176 [Lactifluus volemus]|nr:hypothetical protein BGW80DRAFT_1449176 [Lactifluus volemus]
MVDSDSDISDSESSSNVPSFVLRSIILSTSSASRTKRSARCFNIHDSILNCLAFCSRWMLLASRRRCSSTPNRAASPPRPSHSLCAPRRMSGVEGGADSQPGLKTPTGHLDIISACIPCGWVGTRCRRAKIVPMDGASHTAKKKKDDEGNEGLKSFVDTVHPEICGFYFDYLGSGSKCHICPKRGKCLSSGKFAPRHTLRLDAKVVQLPQSVLRAEAQTRAAPLQLA